MNAQSSAQDHARAYLRGKRVMVTGVCGTVGKQLARQLQTHGLQMKQLFLLHEAFYDDKGRALQPVPEMY